MNYEIRAIPNFIREAKQLSKKYRSLRTDLEKLKAQLLHNPKAGTPLGNSCYKVRMSISTKNRGKSGGARIITHIIAIDELQGEIYLLSIYDKADKDSIPDHEIRNLLKEI
jgi:mRNA-degrading endonuclease RelE of RelBE toxin-antitoxin system